MLTVSLSKHMTKLDLTGKRFGRLLAVCATDLRNGSKSIVWECICDCGKTVLVDTNKLNTSNTTSCGCYKNDLLQATTERRRKYVDKLDAALHRHYLSTKNNARSRDLVFELDFDYFVTLVKQPCYYCGTVSSEIIVNITTDRNRKTVRYRICLRGIDRYNNSLGYTISNSVAACFTCNRAKSTLDAVDFIDMCCKIAEIHNNVNTSKLSS